LKNEEISTSKSLEHEAKSMEQKSKKYYWLRAFSYFVVPARA